MAALKRLRLSPWLIALLAAGWLLEEGFPVQLTVSLIGVFLHEMGHVYCAERMGCTVERIELTPFGGVAHISGMEQLSAPKRIGIALAGPAVNGLLMLGCTIGVRYWPEKAEFLLRGALCNAALLCFNLLPAYPMDGGRVLCALLEGRFGPVRARSLTAGLGTAMGIALAVLGAASFFVVHKFNLTLLLCGGYLCAEARKAHRSTPFMYMTRLMGREKALRRQYVLPVRTIAVRSGTPAVRIVPKLRTGVLYRIVYLDEEMRVKREAWERELWDELK